MSHVRIRSGYGVSVHRKKTLHFIAAAAVIAIVVFVSLFLFVNRENRSGVERKELLEHWENGLYDRVFSASGAALASKPMDYFLLTLHGFSAYQLGIAQINNYDTLSYIDACIWSLRKALLLKNSRNDGRVYYVLGKAYYYKGEGYADLSVFYLEKARELSYRAGDIPEYLGLAYAALRDYRSSVEAFSQALEPSAAEAGEAFPSSGASPSDMLLLSIARSYMALEDLDAALPYLLRCIDISRDLNTRVAARLLSAEIFGKNGEAGKAEAQYTVVLEEAGDNAEAHYQLGELYYARGNTTRTRAELRSALKIDPAHELARARWAQLNP
jgi:tetratricopeptide (TPR) repeat protein